VTGSFLIGLVMPVTHPTSVQSRNCWPRDETVRLRLNSG
jgi:hypothetical protein